MKHENDIDTEAAAAGTAACAVAPAFPAGVNGCGLAIGSLAAHCRRRSSQRQEAMANGLAPVTLVTLARPRSGLRLVLFRQTVDALPELFEGGTDIRGQA